MTSLNLSYITLIVTFQYMSTIVIQNCCNSSINKYFVLYVHLLITTKCLQIGFKTLHKQCHFVYDSVRMFVFVRDKV